MAKKRAGQERKNRVPAAANRSDGRRTGGMLRESQPDLGAIVEAAPIPMAISRVSDGLILCASSHLGPMLGLPPGDVVGRKAPDFYYDPADRQVLLSHLERDGHVYDYEVRVKKADGAPFWVVVSLQTLAIYGEPVLIAGFYDITERKRAEEALRESEERYRALYEDNPSMYFTVDAEGTVLSVNRFGAEQLGYTADELVGQSVLKVFYEGDKEAVQKQLSMCVQNSAEVADWEFRKVRKDGSILWVKEAARAVRGPDGGTIVLIVCEDITQRKEAEEALQKAREELESKVESRMQKENPYGLTFRELATLHLVAEGKSDKEIATLLGISPRTANKHLENILSKMGASSRTEAGVRAVRERLLGQ